MSIKIMYLVIVEILIFNFQFAGQPFKISEMDEILYGVAYYYEYMPYERLDRDAKLMSECGINFVRICESTWGYHERQDGKFHFEHLDRILDVMHSYDIKVIIGTPTYAVPAWLVKKYPEVLAVRRNTENYYGSRQNMDITNPIYRKYAERIIRKLVEYTVDHPAVIGFQVDNETKHYQTEGENVQKLFLEHLKEKFDSPEEMNRAYGLHYWSNSVNNWNDMPSTMGSINGSLNSEFKKFQRSLVTEFLNWQTKIVNEYKRPDQFITHNFDLSWRSGSYAIQKDVDHFEASLPIDVVGIDIYHKTQDELTGMTIAMAGDLARSMKQDNYFVIETSAQSILNSAEQKLHYPGQLRLQAFSHIASGANMIGYWPWHSIHNSAETYWKGILSHDLEPNPTFYEVKSIAGEFDKWQNEIISTSKNNKVAIYFSNESISALEEFPFSYVKNYNDILRDLYNICYRSNIELDFVDHSVKDLSKYRFLIIPPLYCASNEELVKLNQFVEEGGVILYLFKAGFTNENVQVRTDRMPAVLKEVLGFSYQQFTNFESIKLKSDYLNIPDSALKGYFWGELIVTDKAETLVNYDHPHWGKYAAITSNVYGKGKAYYCGTYPSQDIITELIHKAISETGIKSENQYYSFPIIIRNGKNRNGKEIHFIFNYSADTVNTVYHFNNGKELNSSISITKGSKIVLAPWDFKIFIEE